MAKSQDHPCAELVVSSTAGDVQVHGAACLGPSKPVALVGRSEPCEIQVRHSKISGKHLQISWQAGRCELSVLGAMGCFWNDSFLEKDSKVWLENGDIVLLARRNKQDQSQAKETICRFQFCLRSPEVEKNAARETGTAAPEPKTGSPKADGKENQAPAENVATRTDANAGVSAETKKTKEPYIETLQKKNFAEIEKTEEELRRVEEALALERDEDKEGPKMTTEVKAVPEPAASAAAASTTATTAVPAPWSSGESSSVPAPKTPPRYKPAEPKDWEKSGSDSWNMNGWRNRVNRWDPESPNRTGSAAAAPATPGRERCRSRTPARGYTGSADRTHDVRSHASHAGHAPSGDRYDRARSRTPAREMTSGYGPDMQTPHRRDSRGGGFYRDRSSTPARRDRDRSMPAQRMQSGAQQEAAVSPKTCRRVFECMAKVMGVQPAAMMSLRTMPLTQAFNIMIQEAEHPNSTGMCAPEAASSWRYKSTGALELEMNEMGLDADLQMQLMQLPEHEVCSALYRAKTEASRPTGWLIGYVRRFWDTQQGSSQAHTENHLDEDGLELDNHIRSMLRELPEEEAQKAIRKVKQLDCNNPRAWLVGFCKRYWREVQFDKNWST